MLRFYFQPLLLVQNVTESVGGYFMENAVKKKKRCLCFFMCVQDYYGVTFPGTAATMPGRDGLANNPYSGKLHRVSFIIFGIYIFFLIR